MKNLLQKSLTQLTIFAFIVFASSIPSYFFLVDWIWMKELDENNSIIAQRIENVFNDQKIQNDKLAENIDFWNDIQPSSKIIAVKKPQLRDSIYTINRKNSYVPNEINRFRVLKKRIKINNQNYVLLVETNVEETEETVAYIATLTLLFFLILVIGFWILNRKLSKKLWQPFQDTLQKLKSFQLNSQKEIDFQKTDIIEFVELNATLDKLIQHTIVVYKNQKEFTENASHELQTPLAVLKNKLDILIQSEDLTEKQYHLAEEMNKALIRSSLINKNLLLLTKIENQQFDSKEQIVIDFLLNQIMDELQEYFIQKNIAISANILQDIVVKGNKGLIEILINNLIFNAIRYTPSGGVIKFKLTKSGFEIRNSGQYELNSELLFKRFSKLSSESKGIGLGLSIVLQIVKFHNWGITYRFENNEHVFSVLL